MARGIYKIINVTNNKFYVGSAEVFSRRKREHWWNLRRGSHSNKHLQSSWLKYGEHSFVFVIVEEVPIEANLLAAENAWLKEHVGKRYCYNIATDATAPMRGFSGKKNPMWGKTFSHTEDAKARIAAASKNRIQSEEEKEKRRKTMQSHYVSKETRAKISATLSGSGNYWYGKKRPEHGAKVRRAIIAVRPDGSEISYISISALRLDLGLKPPTVNRALKNGKIISRGKFVNWKFKYA